MADIVEELMKAYGIPPADIVDSPIMKSISIVVSKERLKDIIQYLIRRTEYTHLITITAIDQGGGIEVCYHLSNGPKVATIRTHLTDNELRLPTITDISLGASLYEREVHDLFGVTFEGHSNLDPLFLPDNWPSEIRPFRKEWTLERIRSRVDDCESDLNGD